jgi:predicted amidohydrolase
VKRFIIAGAQYAVRPNAIKENVEKAAVWVETAVREHGSRLVVLPESSTTGFTPGMPVPEFYRLVEPVDGPSVKAMCKVARDCRAWICFPTYERGKKKNTIYNSAILISDRGRVAGVYRKTHPFPTERIDRTRAGGGGWTTPGTELPVFDCGFAKVGITICYEGDFPELSRILALKGAEVILRPSALLRSFEIWDLTTRARAYDNHVYMMAVNAVGPDAGGSYYFGHSMIVSPIAQKLAQARGGEEIISAELDPQPLKFVTYGSRSPQIFDHLEDRNVKIYGEILKEGKSGFEPARRIPYRKASRGRRDAP